MILRHLISEFWPLMLVALILNVAFFGFLGWVFIQGAKAIGG